MSEKTDGKLQDYAGGLRTTDEWKKYLKSETGLKDDVNVHESQDYKDWDMSRWHKPPEGELTDAEFKKKYGKKG